MPNPKTPPAPVQLGGKSVPPSVCKVPDCGRKVCTTDLCQTHYKLMRQTGTVRPIHPKQPGRANATRMNALSVTIECKERVTRHAREHGATINATVTDILEEWAREYWAHNKPPRKPGK